MSTTLTLALRHSLVPIAVAALLTACSSDAPVSPNLPTAMTARAATLPAADADRAIATLRRVTARYHKLEVAMADGFVLLHGCESRPGEGPVGAVYVHMDRLLDGVINPELPDALIYEPMRNGRSRLVGVEFAIPYPMWTGATPPQFLGATFQPEDEFGVFALHAWVWRNNPDGLFAESNPRVSCADA